MLNQQHIQNNNFKKDHTESPDSGHKEMSSDSLAGQEGQRGQQGQDHGEWYNSASRLCNGDPQMRRSYGTNNRPDFNLPLKQNNPFSPMSDESSSSSHMLNAANNNPASSDTYSDWSSGSSRHDNQEKTIITPLPSQDATGNRIELNTTPKLEPPPKVVKRNSRLSNTLSGNFDIMSPDSNGNGAGSISSTASSSSLNSDKRSSRDSNRMSQEIPMTTFKPPTLENKQLNTLPKPNKGLDKNSQNLKNVNVNGNVNGNSPLITSQTQADSTTKLRLSFSDEENTENSEDSGVPQQEPKRLDSMTFDEFEALAT